MPNKFLLETAKDIGIAELQRTRNMSAAWIKEVYEDAKATGIKDGSPEIVDLNKNFIKLYEAHTALAVQQSNQLKGTITPTVQVVVPSVDATKPVPTIDEAQMQAYINTANAASSPDNILDITYKGQLLGIKVSTLRNAKTSVDMQKLLDDEYAKKNNKGVAATPTSTVPVAVSTISPAPTTVSTAPVESPAAKIEKVRTALVGTTIQIGDKSISLDTTKATIIPRGENFKVSFENFDKITKSDILVDKDGKLVTTEITITKDGMLSDTFTRNILKTRPGGTEILAFVDALRDTGVYTLTQDGKKISIKMKEVSVKPKDIAPAALKPTAPAAPKVNASASAPAVKPSSSVPSVPTAPISTAAPVKATPVASTPTNNANKYPTKTETELEKFTGKARYTSTDGTLVYSGEWRNGKRDGIGVRRDSNGDVHLGIWKEDMLYTGRVIDKDGKTKHEYNEGRDLAAPASSVTPVVPAKPNVIPVNTPPAAATKPVLPESSEISTDVLRRQRKLDIQALQDSLKGKTQDPKNGLYIQKTGEDISTYVKYALGTISPEYAQAKDTSGNTIIWGKIVDGNRPITILNLAGNIICAFTRDSKNAIGENQYIPSDSMVALANTIPYNPTPTQIKLLATNK